MGLGVGVGVVGGGWGLFHSSWDGFHSASPDIGRSTRSLRRRRSGIHWLSGMHTCITTCLEIRAELDGSPVVTQECIAMHIQEDIGRLWLLDRHTNKYEHEHTRTELTLGGSGVQLVHTCTEACHPTGAVAAQLQPTSPTLMSQCA